MFNIPVNCDGNKLSACHKMANILTVSRKSFHLIDALWISLVLRPFTAEWYDLDRKDGTFLNLFGGEIKNGIFCLDTNDFERGRITDVFLFFYRLSVNPTELETFSCVNTYALTHILWFPYFWGIALRHCINL